MEYSITNLIAGSRVKIRNESTATNIYNEIVAGTSLSGTYTEGVEYTAGNSIALLVANVDGLTAYYGYQSTALAGSTGFSFLANQVLNTIYNGNNVSGSTVTGIVLDQGNVEFDIDEVDNKKTAQEIYAWYENEQMTATGIEVLFGAIMPDSAYRYAINQGTIDLQFDNKDLVNALTITGGYFYRLNGTAVTASGSGTIEMVPNESYVADSSVIQADLTTILADTNELQTNQGAWATATGFTVVSDLASLATETNAISNKVAIIAEVDANEAKLDIIDTVVDSIETKMDLQETKAQADTRQTALIVEIDANETKIDTLIAADAGKMKVDSATGIVTGTVLNVSKGV